MSLNTEDQQYKINLSINADEDIEVDDQREQTVVGDPIYKDSVTYDVALKPTFSGVKDEYDEGLDYNKGCKGCCHLGMLFLGFACQDVGRNKF